MEDRRGRNEGEKKFVCFCPVQEEWSWFSQCIRGIGKGRVGREGASVFFLVIENNS